MAKEQIHSPEQSENELLQSIVGNGKLIAARLQQEFGEVFYPMKFVELSTCKIAYSNPGGDHPMSLRMHQIANDQAAGVEVSLFFKPLPGSEGQELQLFENEQNRSNISDSADAQHSYYFIHQNPDGSLATVPGSHYPELDVHKLQSYSDFIGELPGSLEAALSTDSAK